MADSHQLQKQKVYMLDMLRVLMMTLIPNRTCDIVLHFGHVRNQNWLAQRKVQTTNVIQPSNFSSDGTYGKKGNKHKISV